MSQSSFEFSIYLSHILDFIFGTEDAIRCKRLYHSIDYAKNWTSQMVGSFSDGFRLKDSDVDIMNVLNNYYVADSIYSSKSKCPLHLVFMPDSSGYACLEYKRCLCGRKFFHLLYDGIKHSFIYNLCNDQLLISNTVFSCALNKSGALVVGPSILNQNSLTYEQDNDNVYAFNCQSWPIIANEWIHRSRKYEWPSTNDITLIQSQGCQLVPVGEYDSPINFLQWRVSFVLSEKCLVRAFNNVQFKVYGMLKLLKSEMLYLYVRDDNECLITSYHIKTTMF